MGTLKENQLQLANNTSRQNLTNRDALNAKNFFHPKQREKTLATHWCTLVLKVGKWQLTAGITHLPASLYLFTQEGTADKGNTFQHKEVCTFQKHDQQRVLNSMLSSLEDTYVVLLTYPNANLQEEWSSYIMTYQYSWKRHGLVCPSLQDPKQTSLLYPEYTSSHHAESGGGGGDKDTKIDTAAF